MRYSELWPIQYLVDNLLLLKYRFLKPAVKFEKDVLVVSVPEGLKYLSVKILAGLETLREKNYDLVFRTTLSTVLNYKKFVMITSGFSTDENVYAGYLIDFNENKFVSGSSSLFSKGTVEILAKNRKKINFGRLDDVAFGRVLNHKVNPIALPHTNLGTIDDVNRLSIKDLLSFMSFRCKSISTPRNDDIIAKLLLNRLSDESN
jgi:hypothetical protein